MKRLFIIIPAYLAVCATLALASSSPFDSPKAQPIKPPKTIKAEVHAERVEPTPASGHTRHIALKTQKTQNALPEPTWRGNPQGCNETTHWIALESPHYCIERPVPIQQAKHRNIQTSRHHTPVVAASRTHQDWMAAAGIPQSDWQYVEFIMTKESGGRPDAVNPSSGACGLFQQLPCGKWGHPWNDPVGAMIDATAYARARYGSWAGAHAFWLRNAWW